MYPSGSRILCDGSFFIPRVKKLGPEYLRVGRENRWRLRPTVFLPELETVFKDKIVYIIGKGPSLDQLIKEDFEDKLAPILCVNESILVIQNLEDISNPLFLIQKDTDNSIPGIKENVSLILSESVRHTYLDYSNPKHFFRCCDLGFRENVLTVKCASVISRLLGVKKIIFLAFDHSMGGSQEYANSMNQVRPPQARWNHRQTIISDLVGMEYEFRWPLQKTRI